MKQSNNQRGGMVVEVILAVLVFAFGSYILYHALQSKKPSTVSDQPAVAVKADPYAGWQTFQARSNKTHFKYPADWKADIKYEDQGGAIEGGQITSPDGFVLAVYPSPSGLGGACDDTDRNSESACPLIETFSAEPVTIPGAPNTYLVKQYFLNSKDHSDQNRKSIGLYTTTSVNKDYDEFLTTKEIFGYPPYLIATGGPDNYSDGVWIHGEYPETNPKSAMPAKEYYNLPNLKTAELILKSVSFK